MQQKIDKATNNLLTVLHLSKEYELNSGYFSRKDKKVYAANDVSFNLKTGETYGIVGVSGSGKSTTARMIIQMEKVTSGNIIWEDGSDVTKYDKKKLHEYRQKVRYIFQDPAKSLDPRMYIRDILTEPLRYSTKKYTKADALTRAKNMMELVNLPQEMLERRPMEFSGGQRQRISIARALITEPKLLICDEVVSALDVSIQGQIINLLVDLKKKWGLSYIFITHDLKVASYFCDKIGVMYKGVLVEEGTSELYKTAKHPYTKLLFSGADYNLDIDNIGDIDNIDNNLESL